MLLSERRNKILEYLNSHGKATVKELSQLLNVTEATLRTDLNSLEKEGLIERIHGGAILKENSLSEYSFLVREKKNRKEKIAIGHAAAELVTSGQCILLDASTTALEMARILKRKKMRLTAITNGIFTAMELKENPEFTVILTGGIIRVGSIALEGTLGQNLFKQVHIDTMFTSPNGFTFEEGLTDFNVYEVELKKIMVTSVSNLVALVDHSKIGKSSIASYADTKQINTFITDNKSPLETLKVLKENGIKTIVAKSNEISEG